MPALKISSMVVRHDPAQDRILLIVRDSLGTEQVLLLTRRLTFSLVATLGKLIQQNQAAGRPADTSVQAELLSMQHAQALSQVRQAQAGRAPPQAPPRRLPSRLLTQIDIREDEIGRAITFSNPDGPLAALSLDARQVHWFLGRLAVHSRSAGWGDAIPVPAWLDESRAAEFALSEAKTHLLH